MKELVSSDVAYQEAVAGLHVVVKEAISQGGHAISGGSAVRYPSHKGVKTSLIRYKAGSNPVFPWERWDLQTPGHQPMPDGEFMIIILEPRDSYPSVVRVNSTTVYADFEHMSPSPDTVQALVIATQCLRAELG